MKQIAPILLLILLAGCASQLDPETYTRVAIQRAEHNYQEEKLRDKYRKGFIYGFVHGGIIDIFGSDNPDGDSAYLMGHSDGRRARLEYEMQKAKEKR